MCPVLPPAIFQFYLQLYPSNCIVQQYNHFSHRLSPFSLRQGIPLVSQKNCLPQRHLTCDLVRLLSMRRSSLPSTCPVFYLTESECPMHLYDLLSSSHLWTPKSEFLKVLQVPYNSTAEGHHLFCKGTWNFQFTFPIRIACPQLSVPLLQPLLNWGVPGETERSCQTVCPTGSSQHAVTGVGCGRRAGRPLRGFLKG